LIYFGVVCIKKYCDESDNPRVVVMKNNIYLSSLIMFCVLIIAFPAKASAFQEFSIAGGGGNQQNPDIDGKIVVYENDQSGNWDIQAADISSISSPAIYSVANYTYDQRQPSISKYTVAWQDNVDGDWDIWTTDISDLV